MKVRFTPRAAQDIAAIADYFHARSPSIARQVRAAILHSLQTLILFPQVGRAQTVEGARKLVTRKYPYLVLSACIAHAVLHESLDFAFSKRLKDDPTAELIE